METGKHVAERRGESRTRTHTHTERIKRFLKCFPPSIVLESIKQVSTTMQKRSACVGEEEGEMATSILQSKEKLQIDLIAWTPSLRKVR